MQNLLLGTSGSGKSYECVVYQVLPALANGRKIITNLPLNLDYFQKLHPEYLPLIEIRKKPLPIRGNWNPDREGDAFEIAPEDHWLPRTPDERNFSSCWDFYDTWRHPENGSGCLFIIDEAQNYIPYGKTSINVEEWTALHRHWFQDVIWITQSYGKISKTIRENLQMVYRFRKKTAWGQPDRYIRKVQDGLKGEVLNVMERKYEKKYFPYYRSHTQASGSGVEFNAQDVKGIYSHWSFKGAALMLVIFLGLMLSGKVKNPLKPEILDANNKFELDPKVLTELETKPIKQSLKIPGQQSDNLQPKSTDPLGDKGIHITAHIKSKTKELWMFSISQNGQHVYNTYDSDLVKTGYTFIPKSECFGYLTFNTITRPVSCDAPQQSVKTAI
jgi:zona occludens toxin